MLEPHPPRHAFAPGREPTLRLYHPHKHARYEDWHYDGLPVVPGAGEALFLGAGPRSYSANLFRIFF